MCVDPAQNIFEISALMLNVKVGMRQTMMLDPVVSDDPRIRVTHELLT